MYTCPTRCQLGTNFYALYVLPLATGNPVRVAGAAQASGGQILLSGDGRRVVYEVLQYAGSAWYVSDVP